MSAAAYVLGIARDERSVASAVEELRRSGYAEIETFSPLPSEEQAEQSHRSPVRFYSLAGGVIGLASGVLLTAGTALAWPILTGGKPIVSIPPFLVITFELTVLCAGIFTIAGMLIHAGLVRDTHRVVSAAARDARFSADRFGVLTGCSTQQVEAVKRMMLAAGMEEVRGGESAGGERDA